MKKNLLWIAGAAGVTAYLLFGKKIKALLKEQVKDWGAGLMSQESGLPKDLTRPATEMILD